MSSWTDKAPTFNPYVQQVPVETMAMVGMQKQQQYDTNVQRITEQIDKVAGLDIVRDIDKTYLQSKLNELGNNLRTFAASDFSNYQLTNSTVGMVNNVAKDKYVINAVNSTAKYRKELEFMEEARKKGELTEQNKYDFDLSANSWIGSNELGQSFDGSYKPYYDRVKHVRDIINEMKPDGKTFDDLYTVDSKGNLILSPTMRKLKMKGLMPQRVREAIDYAFSDPRVKQQVEIDGQYSYRGLDSEPLVQKLEYLKDATVGALTREEESIRIKIASGLATEKDLEKVETALENVEQRFIDMSELAYSNPNQVRKMLFTEEEKAKLVNTYSWMETSEEVLENPEWVWNYKRLRDDIEDQQWSAEFKLKEDESKAKIDKLKAETNAIIAEEQNANATNNNTTGATNTTELKIPTDYSKAVAAETQYTEAKQNFTNASLDLINAGIIEQYPEYKDMFVQARNNGMSYDDANKTVILEYIKRKRLDSNGKAALEDAESVLNNPNSSYSEKLKATNYISQVYAQNEAQLVADVVSGNIISEYGGQPAFDENGELLVQSVGVQLSDRNPTLSKAITTFVDSKNELKYHEQIKEEIDKVKTESLNSAGVFSALDSFVAQTFEKEGVSTADFSSMSEEDKEYLRTAPIVELKNRGTGKLNKNYKLPESIKISSKDYLMYTFYKQKEKAGVLTDTQKANAYNKISEEGKAYFRQKHGPEFEAYIQAFYNKGATNPSLTVSEFYSLEKEVEDRLAASNTLETIGQKLDEVYNKYITTTPSVAVSIQPPSTNKDFEKLKKNRLDHIQSLVKNMEEKNESPTFDNFVKYIAEAKDLSGIDVAVRVTDDQQRIYTIRAADGSEMVVQEKDVIPLGINYPALLIDRKASMIQKIISSGTYTSKTDPNDEKTYKNRDYVLSNSDLPHIADALTSTQYTVGINFTPNRDGTVTPTIFIQDLAAPDGFKNFVILKNYIFNPDNVYNVIHALKAKLTRSELERIMAQEYQKQKQELENKNNQ